MIHLDNGAEVKRSSTWIFMRLCRAMCTAVRHSQSKLLWEQLPATTHHSKLRLVYSQAEYSLMEVNPVHLVHPLPPFVTFSRSLTRCLFRTIVGSTIPTYGRHGPLLNIKMSLHKSHIVKCQHYKKKNWLFSVCKIHR